MSIYPIVHFKKMTEGIFCSVYQAFVLDKKQYKLSKFCLDSLGFDFQGCTVLL